MQTCSKCRSRRIPTGFGSAECAARRWPSPMAGERRSGGWSSSLFADLAGFTSRSESLDVEDVEGFLAPYLGSCGRRLSGLAASSSSSRGMV